ncbi:MAG: hypothetical protein J6B09_05985 [Clostridia bacterium]|nr:hypothetical protein [Clostridia bacterium]MBQ8716568.1 hypothetical protein [Clostridia bacterium]
MYIELIAEILLAVLAVFGLYAMMRLFVTSRLLPARAGFLIEIREGTTAQDVPLLLNRVKDALFLCGTGRIVALIDLALKEETALLDALREEGVAFYFVNL